MEQYGDRVLPVALDVTDHADAQRAVADGMARFGRHQDGLREGLLGHPVSLEPPYVGTAGAVIAMMSADGDADDYADPARVAALVLSIAELENPPVRLLAGSAVLSQGVDANRARAEAVGEWAWRSRKAD